MPLETRFHPALYEEFRPNYPQTLFQEVLRRCGTSPTRILDVGCGTGISTFNFSEALKKTLQPFSIVGVDRDEKMLPEVNCPDPTVQFHCASAENLPFSERAFDFVMSGSAFHWFDPDLFESELHRVLDPGGKFFVFEYQFPRTAENPELNAWIKTQFNRNWVAPHQTPRGNLRSLTERFRESSHWREIGIHCPPLHQELTPPLLLGQILSQSRYLHSETGLTGASIRENREALFDEIQRLYAGKSAYLFDFYLSAYLFQWFGYSVK